MDRTEGGYARCACEGTRVRRRFSWSRDEWEDGSGDSGNYCPEEGEAGKDPPHHDGDGKLVLDSCRVLLDLGALAASWA